MNVNVTTDNISHIVLATIFVITILLGLWGVHVGSRHDDDHAGAVMYTKLTVAELVIILIALAQYALFDIMAELVPQETAIWWSRWCRLWIAVVFIYLFSSGIYKNKKDEHGELD